MDTNKRQAAERIRPILEAMERSIDSARRRRVNTGPLSQQPPVQTPAQMNNPVQRIGADHNDRDELIGPAPQKLTQPGHQRPEPPVFPQRDSNKLKARPKRPAGFAASGQPPFYGAKAG